jgi:hypothetical protein
VDRNVVGELGVNTMYHATDHLLLMYNANYNARDGKFAGNRVGIKILSKCECWTLGFTVNNKINPNKTSFSFDFNLLGLGSQNKDLFGR